MIELKEVLLSKMKRVPGGNVRGGCYDHTLLKERALYLAKIDGSWYGGTFTKQPYGWNFNAVYMAGYQLSYGSHPTKNGWEQLYIIIDKSIKTYPLNLRYSEGGQP